MKYDSNDPVHRAIPGCTAKTAAGAGRDRASFWPSVAVALGLLALSSPNVWAASRVAGSGSAEELVAMVAYACLSLVVTSLIETVVYGRALRLSLGKAIRLSGLVNLASIVGCVPLGILLGGSEHALIPLAARWGWSAFALMLAAWAIETFVARWRLPKRPVRSLAVPALLANASSYGLYLLLSLAL